MLLKVEGQLLFVLVCALKIDTFWALKVAADTLPPEGLEFCDWDEQDDAQSDDSDSETSFCQEVMLNDQPSLYNQDDNNILAAMATSVLNRTYPSRINSQHSFAGYDELPYPVPLGVSSYFMVLFTVIFTWYFSKFLHWLLKDTEKRLDLFPVTDHFPNLNLYMLQQTRRETQLQRDVRNSWGWLAGWYLLQTSDKDVNADEIFRNVGWSDFQVPHDVWGMIQEVLRVNATGKAVSRKDDEESVRKSMSDVIDVAVGATVSGKSGVSKHYSSLDAFEGINDRLANLKQKVAMTAEAKENDEFIAVDWNRESRIIELRKSVNSEHLTENSFHLKKDSEDHDER